MLSNKNKSALGRRITQIYIIEMQNRDSPRHARCRPNSISVPSPLLTTLMGDTGGDNTIGGDNTTMLGETVVETPSFPYPAPCSIKPALIQKVFSINTDNMEEFLMAARNGLLMASHLEEKFDEGWVVLLPTRDFGTGESPRISRPRYQGKCLQ